MKTNKTRIDKKALKISMAILAVWIGLNVFLIWYFTRGGIE